MNDVVRTIKERRSVRHFSQDPISDNDLAIILESAIYAPNQANKQNWHFSVIRGPEIVAELTEAARIWMSNSEIPAFRERAARIEYDLFYGAPVNIVVSGDEQDRWSMPGCAAAVQNMLLAADSLGLGACWKNMLTGLLNSEHGQMYKDKLGIPKIGRASCRERV